MVGIFHGYVSHNQRVPLGVVLKWWFSGNLMTISWDLPSGKLTLCYWKLPIEIVDLCWFTYSGGSFHSYVTVYQRVHGNLEWIGMGFNALMWFHGIPTGVQHTKKMWKTHGVRLGKISSFMVGFPHLCSTFTWRNQESRDFNGHIMGIYWDIINGRSSGS